MKSYLKCFILLQVNHFYLLLYSFIVESSSSSLAPKPPSKLWATLLKYQFCSLRSSWIPTNAEETSCLHPPVPLPSDSASDSTSTQLFFFGHDPSPPDWSRHFQLETRILETVQTIFWATQWSQDFCWTPSGGHMQYCVCLLHQSNTQSHLVPGCSLCFSFQFWYQIQSQLLLTCLPLLVNRASNFSGIIITHLLFNS